MVGLFWDVGGAAAAAAAGEAVAGASAEAAGGAGAVEAAVARLRAARGLTPAGKNK